MKPFYVGLIIAMCFVGIVRAMNGDYAGAIVDLILMAAIFALSKIDKRVG